MRRTRCAAAAAAASGEAPVGACLSHRYISYSPVIPTTALYIARWVKAKYRKLVGPAGADTVVTVTSFQNVMTAGLAADAGGLAATGVAVARVRHRSSNGTALVAADRVVEGWAWRMRNLRGARMRWPCGSESSRAYSYEGASNRFRSIFDRHRPRIGRWCGDGNGRPAAAGVTPVCTRNATMAKEARERKVTPPATR